MKAAREPPVEKLFNLSKNSKEDAPLDGLVNYIAYKIEERKFNLRYPTAIEESGKESEYKLHD